MSTAEAEAMEDSDLGTVRVAADQGLADAVADKICARLDGHRLSSGTVLHAEAVSLPLPPVESGRPDMETWSSLLATGSEEGENADAITLCVSEIPRRVGSRPVLAEIVGTSMVVIYVPSFGARAVARRAGAVALTAIESMRRRDDDTDDGSPVAPDHPTPATGLAHWSVDSGHDILLAPALLGRTRMVAGMIRTNRPWRLVPALSGALAAATATSAFGVFYSSIWQMAASMSVLRLTCVSVIAVALITAWLILPNGLWERRTRRQTGVDRAMYNMATLATVFAGVLFMYVALFLVVGAASAVVISPEFLSMQIDREAGVVDYVRLAWLAASLGTVAGAVGSTVADQEQILGATFGHREAARRRAAKSRLSTD
ncbi:hypothetical protein [Rhodococcoides corynebacterioides]|uniref:hypothetical protein n=1 Tax=Rhodococcoides corynebacterioides TaxID=53972 RepID=UPI001FE5B45E|nr:hypothetical protein [Rhodococcus corynebacterioides]